MIFVNTSILNFPEKSQFKVRILLEFYLQRS